MSNTSLPTPFKPVRGTEENILASTTENGGLYFATDTRKTYLGMKDGTKILMGYDTGIFYGTKEIPADNSGNPLNPEVYFNKSEIEGARLPIVGDLILNIDGCFYRVEMQMDGDIVKTKRLTLQGTGGGGGGTGGPTTGGSSFNISFTNANKQYAFSTESPTMKVGFVSYYNGTDDNYLSAVSFFLSGQEEPFHTATVNSDGQPLVFNQPHFIDLIDFKHLFNSTNTTVKVAIYDKYGVDRSDDIKIRLVTISLSAVETTLIPVLDSTLDFRCKLTGGTSGVSDKKLIYTFYKEEDLKKPIHEVVYNLNLNDTDTITKDLDMSTLEHGIYILKVQATANITGAMDSVESNVLTHKLGYFTETSSPLLLVLAPEITEQYTDIPVSYLYVTNDVNKDYTLEIRIDNVFFKDLSIKSNVAQNYNFYFEESGSKKLQFTIKETGVSSTLDFLLTEYTGNLPVIDLNNDSLMLYLNPKGKTNNDAKRDEWADAKRGQLIAKLTGLNYSQLDGWTVDPGTGDSCLKLISGAKLDMGSDFHPFSADPVNGSRANGMTIELDFEVSGILDYSQTIMSCMSYDIVGTPTVGFALVGDQLRMYNNRLNGKNPDPTGRRKDYLSSQTIVEGKRIKASIVIEPDNGTIDFPMCYTYLNGKLSEATIYDKDDTFIDGYHPAELQVDSTYAQIKIYGIRFYNAALSEKVILNNYTALLPTLAERQKAYDSNNVYSGANISFDLVSAEDYDLQIPYMKLTGGYKCSSADKWTIDTTKNVGLPTGKKDYRLVDVEVVYPKNAYFAGYENYSYKNVFDNGLTMEENLGIKPNNGGAIMYCQGTSSMEYPTKNLRLRWKKEKNFFQVRPNLDPVEIICMKADYMESSGSHNTGAANLVDDIYDSVNMKTPGQLHNWDSATSTWKSGKRTVTCIKGHPCLIFYSPSGAPGTYEYIGKYNLNLDKATPEPFGFLHDEETNFGYLKDEEGKVVLDANGNKQNSIFCYEFLDNAAYPVCNFLITSLADQDGNVPTTYHDTWYKTFWHVKDKAYYPGWRMGFESRYPEDEEDPHSADAFYPLANWVNELYNLRVGIAQYAGQANEAEALRRFKDEYWKYLDKDFTITYYLVTEALLMADSRVKNMMIATWGKEWRYRLANGTITSTKPTKGNAVEGTPTGDDYNAHFGYIFYPIFYDMDTMLGLNNEGRLKFKYYTEDTEENVYNGANVLWHLVRDSLPTEILVHFSALENGKLHAPLILPYFNDNQANMANEAFYNGDAAYKYVGPARAGYEDLLNGQKIEPGAAPYLYALQGDRSLHRESFINNRMQYLRGKYNSTKFLAGDRVAFRWNTPSENDTNPQLAQSAKDVPPDGLFTFTGLKTGFAGIQLGENGQVISNKFTPGQEHTFNMYAAEADGTEAFLLGVSALSDIGDLSNKYMGKFVISSTDNRLKRLTLGNPHKNYYNPNWGDGSENIIVNSQYLEYFNLQNCSMYNRPIDLSNNPVIRTVLFTGSGVSALTLPENGVLQELRLPDTLVNFKIVGHTNLQADKFSMGPYHYGTTNKIGAENDGGYYGNNFANLTDIHVVNTPIDTYEMVQGAKLLQKYYLHNIDWKINAVDPDRYCKRKSSWVYDTDADGNPITLGDSVPAGQYYTLRVENGELLYDLYEGTTYPTGNNFLYEKVSMLKGTQIVSIPTLDYLLTLNERADDTPHNQALSGKITINVPDTSVIELDIYDKYKDHYPNIVIEYGNNVEVEAASTINFFAGTADNEYVTSVNGVAGLTPGHFALTAQDAHTLAELIGDYVPIKVQTISNTFTFTGQWVDWADPAKPTYYQEVPGFEIPSDKAAFKFTNFKPAKDMDLVPVFRTNVRQYLITLFDHDESMILSAKIDYDQDIGTFFETNVTTHPEYSHAYYNYRPYTNEAKPHNRWAFKGWQTVAAKKANAAVASYSYLNGQVVSSDVAFYAFYEEENANEKVSMIARADDFFDYKENYTTEYRGETISGAQISLKDKYRFLLQGKITLPTKSPQGTPIVSVGCFNALPGGIGTRLETDPKIQVAEFYFLDDGTSAYKEISDRAFSASSDTSDSGSLTTAIYLPNTITVIRDNAFRMMKELKTVNFNNGIRYIGNAAFWNCRGITSVGLDELPTDLELLGTSALYAPGPGIRATHLPVALTTLESYCLSLCENVHISTFGSMTNPIIYMAAAALYQSSNNTITDITIYCTDKAILPKAFENYNVNVSKLTIYSPTGEQDYSQWLLNTTTGVAVQQLPLNAGG